MVKALIIDKTGHQISIPDLVEIRYEGYENDDVVIKDFNTFKIAESETYAFIGDKRTVNITGMNIKSVIFDKAD